MNTAANPLSAQFIFPAPLSEQEWKAKSALCNVGFLALFSKSLKDGCASESTAERMLGSISVFLRTLENEHLLMEEALVEPSLYLGDLFIVRSEGNQPRKILMAASSLQMFAAPMADHGVICENTIDICRSKIHAGIGTWMNQYAKHIHEKETGSSSVK